jgi:hypothetical protein
MTPPRRPAIRLVLAAAAAALLFPVSAGVAAAQGGAGTTTRTGVVNDVKTCEGGRCDGTDAADTIVASNATQQVYGYKGDDDIELDVIFTSGSSDVGIGGEGRDCIDAAPATT